MSDYTPSKALLHFVPRHFHASFLNVLAVHDAEVRADEQEKAAQRVRHLRVEQAVTEPSLGFGTWSVGVPIVGEAAELTEYTPTTDDVKGVYALFGTDGSSLLSFEREAEFDRWNAPRENALAAVQRVRELHEDYKGTCAECSDPEDGITVFFPCNTIAALDGNHE